MHPTSWHSVEGSSHRGRFTPRSAAESGAQRVRGSGGLSARSGLQSAHHTPSTPPAPPRVPMLPQGWRGTHCPLGALCAPGLPLARFRARWDSRHRPLRLRPWGPRVWASGSRPNALSRDRFATLETRTPVHLFRQPPSCPSLLSPRRAVPSSLPRREARFGRRDSRPFRGMGPRLALLWGCASQARVSMSWCNLGGFGDGPHLLSNGHPLPEARALRVLPLPDQWCALQPCRDWTPAPTIPLHGPGAPASRRPS